MSDLDESSAAEAADLLLKQRASYAALARALGDDQALETNPDRLRELVVATGRIVLELSSQTGALSTLASRLRRPGCMGPRATATRTLMADVQAQAAEAGARLEGLIAVIRLDQERTLGEINQMTRDTPLAYLAGRVGPAILVDRTG